MERNVFRKKNIICPAIKLSVEHSAQQSPHCLPNLPFCQARETGTAAPRPQLQRASTSSPVPVEQTRLNVHADEHHSTWLEKGETKSINSSIIGHTLETMHALCLLYKVYKMFVQVLQFNWSQYIDLLRFRMTHCNRSTHAQHHLYQPICQLHTHIPPTPTDDPLWDDSVPSPILFIQSIACPLPIC